ncbi:MAG TPA: M23 family metallopeptidase [Solirubrobacteraceae bacterium]|nr:M23 family metallopeptidase [Solirubrobacteraceae bacterium]
MLALALLALIAPVPGDVTARVRPRSPYEGGRHRGVDLATAPETPVRAACGGPVAFTGRIGGTGIVTVRCGRWRVTHMPLARIAARGDMRRGAVIGTVAASTAHHGLRLGVRRDGTRFDYVDPLRHQFLNRVKVAGALAGFHGTEEGLLHPRALGQALERHPRGASRATEEPAGGNDPSLKRAHPFRCSPFPCLLAVTARPP